MVRRLARVPFNVALVFGWLLLAFAGRSHAFGFDDLAARAAELARQPYRQPPSGPKELLGLSYDAYRDIRFNPKQAHWRDAALPFRLMFFHAGRDFRHPIRLYEVDAGTARPIVVPRESFDYGRNAAVAPRGGSAEVAGFRVHYPLNRPDVHDEVVVFLGASYFRAIGAGMPYGLSARGLGVETVGGSGEEFPAFESFWIERPARDAHELVIHALLNGPRVTGAYRFVLKPGAQTAIDVRARVFPRAPLASVGLAPLTSMFFSGENQPRNDDFRPEIHDSDGLQIATADGEWIWRPLTNPPRPFVSSFAMRGVRGFGLMQRDRQFSSYEDPETRYDRRPSAWITPKGEWGAGRVELYQFHNRDETDDNVVAYWVPATLPKPGEPLDVAYEIRFQAGASDDGGDERPPNGWAMQSRRGRSYATPQGDELQFNVDFVGPALKALPADAPIEAIASADANASVQFVQAYRHPVLPGWRMTLKVQRQSKARPVELRAFLRHRNQVLTETWSYAVPPE